MTVTILKVKYVSEETLFEYGSLPIEFDMCCSSPKSSSSSSSPSTCKSKSNSKRKQQVKWSEEDDRILRMYAEKEYSWKEIASNFLNDKFTPQQLHQRWKRVLNDSINREPWSEEEDKAIIEYVKKYGCTWSKLRTLLGTQRTDTMVRQRWLKITNGQGQVGVASKHNQPTSLASLSNSPNSNTNTESIPTTTQPNIQSIVNSFNQDFDVFDFIKKHQLITPNQTSTITQPPIIEKPIKKPAQPISLDSLTCDEELFDQRTVKSEPKTTIAPSIKDIDPAADSAVSSSLSTLLENKYDLMDFHSSLQTNLEKEWLNQIFSQDF